MKSSLKTVILFGFLCVGQNLNLQCEMLETLLLHSHYAPYISLVHDEATGSSTNFYGLIDDESITFSIKYAHDSNNSNNTYEITNLNDHSSQFTIDSEYSQIYLLETNDLLLSYEGEEQAWIGSSYTTYYKPYFVICNKNSTDTWDRLFAYDNCPIEYDDAISCIYHRGPVFTSVTINATSSILSRSNINETANYNKTAQYIFMLYQYYCGSYTTQNLGISVMKRDSGRATTIETITTYYGVETDLLSIDRSKYVILNEYYDGKYYVNVLLTKNNNISVYSFELIQDYIYGISKVFEVNLMQIKFNETKTIEQVLISQGIDTSSWTHMSYLLVDNYDDNTRWRIIGGKTGIDETSDTSSSYYVFIILQVFTDINLKYEETFTNISSIISINTMMNEDSDEWRTKRLTSFIMNQIVYVIAVWKYSDYQINGIIFDSSGVIFKDEFIVAWYNASYNITEPITVINYQNKAITVSYCTYYRNRRGMCEMKILDIDLWFGNYDIDNETEKCIIYQSEVDNYSSSRGYDGITAVTVISIILITTIVILGAAGLIYWLNNRQLQRNMNISTNEKKTNGDDHKYNGQINSKVVTPTETVDGDVIYQ